MRRVVWAVGLCVALLLLVGGGIALVVDGPAAETPTARDDAALVRPLRRTAEAAAVADGTPDATGTAVGADVAPAAPPARSGDDWTPPLAPDALDDPLREARGDMRTRGSVGVGGKIGGGFADVSARIRATGVVLDARTGNPVADARVTVFIPREDRPWGYSISGRDAAEDGTFTVATRSVGAERKRAAELAVIADGYRGWRAPLDHDDLRVELEPVAAGDLSGTISGRVTDDRDRRLYGPVLFSLRDEFGTNESQWAIAGKDGRFRLLGVPPGCWWLRVFDHADQAWTEVRVAAGTEATAELRGVLLREPPAPGGFGPRREVVVRSPAGPGGLAEHGVVRAENGQGLFWRTTVLDGEARFELPRGSWTIVSRRDGETVRKWVEVVLGSGPQIVSLDE